MHKFPFAHAYRAQDFVRARFTSEPNVSLRERSTKGEDMDGTERNRDETRIICAAELRQLVPFSDSYFWRLEKAGQFPRRIKIGQHRVGWALNEILAWIEARKAQRGRS